MLRLEWLTAEGVGEKHVFVVEDVEGQVGRITLLGMAHDVGR